MGQFSTQLKAFATNTENRLSRVYRRSSLDVLRRLIIRSPVDTGRFRGNWQTGIDVDPEGVVEAMDKVGSTTISDGESAISEAKIGGSIFIVNNLPYGPRLEDGWSQQAPTGMVAITVAEWPGIVEDAVDAERG